MPVFFCRLTPPRPTFLQDITPEERQLMQAHAVYWKSQAEQGHVVAFGLVADPAAAFGAAVVEGDTEDDVRAYAMLDPVIQADRGFRMDIFPMPGAFVRPRSDAP